MPTLAQELSVLYRLKKKAEALGTKKSAADAAFKQKQTRALARMEYAEAGSFRHDKLNVLFTKVADRVKGQVDDRRLFVRWALEADEGIAEFLVRLARCTTLDGDDVDLEEAFYDAIMNTELVTYKENGTACNSMAKAHVDDETPLPPGLSFRPDPYIQQLKS